MRQSSEKPNLLTTDAAGVQPSPQSAMPPESELFAAEAQQLREEKLAAICQAVENGAYDSDDLLEKALGRMLQKLDLSNDSSEISP